MDLFQQPLNRGEGQKKKRSFLGRTWRGTRFIAGGPMASLDVHEIARGANLIERLYGIVRSGPTPDARLKTLAGGWIDLDATSSSFGITVEELKQRLLARRSQTALSAYVMAVLGTGLFGLWLYSALHMPMSRSRVFAAIEYLPFCAVFFLLAFKSAWLNWQLRTQRLGSAIAYLQTTDPFLPR